MALFRAITTADDLPPAGAGRESGTFDFKGYADPTKQLKLAQHVAAFANALGGIVLVGAIEDENNHTLERYRPMELAKAEALKTAYELAVTQRCHPPPRIDAVRIECDGGHVVAVNVYPTPLGPVGIRCNDDMTKPAFTFPLRTATQTHFMTPTELAMVMVPEIRRVAIVLDSIPLDQREDVFIIWQGPNGGTNKVPALFRGIDSGGIESLVTTVTLDVTRKGHTPGAVTLPIDCIRSVWRRDATHWNIALDGALLHMEGSYLAAPRSR